MNLSGQPSGSNEGGRGLTLNVQIFVGSHLREGDKFLSIVYVSTCAMSDHIAYSG